MHHSGVMKIKLTKHSVPGLLKGLQTYILIYLPVAVNWGGGSKLFVGHRPIVEVCTY